MRVLKHRRYSYMGITISETIEHNQLAAENRFPDEPTRRLDKVLLRKDKQTFRLEVKKSMFSDHYPIVLTISE